jgi:hypothetical protein
MTDGKEHHNGKQEVYWHGCASGQRFCSGEDDAGKLVMESVIETKAGLPRKNTLLKVGNKNDRVDARKLSELLRVGLLTPVYHGDSGVRTVRELSRSYLTVTKDLARVMNRTKALYRSWAIPCAGEKVYSPRHRNTWLEKLQEAGVRRRAEQLYQQLDALMKIPTNFSGRFRCWARSESHF